MSVKPRKAKLNPAIVVALIGLAGTLITALFTSPVLIELIKRSSATQTPSSASPVPSDSSALIFTQNFDDGSLGSFTVRNGDGKIVRDKSNPALQFSAIGTSWPAGTMYFGPSEISDAVIEFRLKFKELSGLYFNFREQPNGDTYSIAFDPTDSTVLWATNTTDGANWRFSPIIAQPFTFQQDVWYPVRVEVRGDKVVLTISGNLVISASDSSFRSGGLRFELQPGAIVLLDDVNIWSYEQ